MQERQKMEYKELDKEKELHRRIYKKVGIYFLIKNNEVVYVGQTVRGLTRIYNHLDKEWDSFYFMDCDKDVLLKTEKYYIEKYKPKYNKEITSEYSSMREVAQVVNNKKIFNKTIYGNDISKFIKLIKYKTRTSPIKKDEIEDILKVINENRWAMYNVIENRGKR